MGLLKYGSLMIFSCHRCSSQINALSKIWLVKANEFEMPAVACNNFFHVSCIQICAFKVGYNI